MANPKEGPKPATWILCAAFLVLWAQVLGVPAGLAEEIPQAAKGPADETLEWTVLDERTGEGEVCVVCKQQIYGKEVLQIRCKGRRFYVSADMLKDFEADPLRYFIDLEARSGLFDERATDTAALGPGWLVFGSYVFVGLLFSALCGYLAIGRGHVPLPWFFAGLLGNVAAFALLLVTPRGTVSRGARTRAPAPCPHCGDFNHPVAAACSGCGAALQPAIEPEMARVQEGEA